MEHHLAFDVIEIQRAAGQIELRIERASHLADGGVVDERPQHRSRDADGRRMQDRAASGGVRRAPTEQRQRCLPGRGDGGSRVVPRELAQLEPSVLDVRADEKVFDRGEVGTRLDHARADLGIGCVCRRFERSGHTGEQHERTLAGRDRRPCRIGRGGAGGDGGRHGDVVEVASEGRLQRIIDGPSRGSPAARYGQRPRDGHGRLADGRFQAVYTHPVFVVAHARGLAQRHGERLHLPVQPTHFERGTSRAPLLERPARFDADVRRSGDRHRHGEPGHRSRQVERFRVGTKSRRVRRVQADGGVGHRVERRSTRGENGLVALEIGVDDDLSERDVGRNGQAGRQPGLAEYHPSAAAAGILRIHGA